MRTFYVDGSCKGDDSGGFGVVELIDKLNIYEVPMHHSEYFENTTNNRMELLAILYVCEQIIDKSDNKEECYTIYSDSAYAVNMLNSWIFSWEAHGWTRSKGQEVLNLDLVKRLYNYVNTNFFKNQVIIAKTSGHCGIVGNELADALATNDMKKFEKILKENNIEV